MSNINQENQEFCSKIEQVIFKDPGNRGISKTFQPGNLYKAANNILLTEKTKKSYILTGFCCMNNTCETDGPLSSAILCKILKELNYDSSILCDTPSEKVVKASAELYKLPVTVKDSSDKVLEEDKNIGFMVSIERPGRSEKTNDYRTCKARDISNVTSSLDLLFPNIKDNKKVDYLTISVGDGGNEVGTGNIIDLIKQNVPMGEDICTISSCDILIMTGVSNWGGIAIAAALSILANNKEIGQKFIEINNTQKDILQNMVNNGSYDGISGKVCMKVDGMDFDKEHTEINKAIEEIVKQKYNL